MSHSHNQEHSQPHVLQAQDPLHYTFGAEGGLIVSHEYEARRLEEYAASVNNKIPSSVGMQIKAGLASTGCQDKYELVQIIDALCYEISRLSQSAVRISAQKRRTERIIVQREDKHERMENQIKQMSKEKISLGSRVEGLEAKIRAITQKAALEKEELKKQIAKLFTKQKGYEVELRKKDREIREFKDKFKKMNEKLQKTAPKHIFQVHSIPKSELSKKFDQGTTAYQKLTMQKVQQSYNMLSKQNEKWKQHIGCLHRLLNNFFGQVTIHIEHLKDSNQILKPFANISLSPASIEQNLSQTLKIIEGLINKVKEFPIDSRLTHQSSRIQHGDTDKLKQIISSFKSVVGSQQQLISRVTELTSDYQIDGKAVHQKYGKAIQNHQFDTLKTVLSQQMEFLERNRHTLVQSKKRLVNSQKVVEEIREELFIQYLDV